MVWLYIEGVLVKLMAKGFYLERTGEWLVVRFRAKTR